MAQAEVRYRIVQPVSIGISSGHIQPLHFRCVECDQEIANAFIFVHAWGTHFTRHIVISESRLSLYA